MSGLKTSIFKILHDSVDFWRLADYFQQMTMRDLITIPLIHTALVLATFAVIYYGYQGLLRLYKLIFDVYVYQPELKHLQGRARSKLGRVSKPGEKVELPPAVPNGWYYIMASADLKNEQVKHVNMLGLDLAVFRDDNGMVHVLDAFCPHIGANMAIGGKVKGNCLECPFHAWQFDGRDGACTHIPGAKKIPSIAKTKSWPVIERNLVIMLWFDAEERDPQWEPREFEEVQQNGWVMHARGEHIMHAHISEIPENGADIAHFNPVHAKNVILGSSLADLNKSGDGIAEHCWSKAHWFADKDESHIARGTLQHELKVWGLTMPFSDAHTTFEQIGPAMVYLQPNNPILGGRLMLLMFVVPLETFKQKVVHISFGRPSFLGKLQSIAGLRLEGTMVERDAVLWNNKIYRPKGILAATHSDELIVKFRRWYAQFYSESSQEKTIQKTDLLW